MSKKIAIIMITLFLIFSASYENLGSEVKLPMQSLPPPKNTSNETNFSDLSIERIYLKGCTIFIIIENKGKGGVSLRDYKSGKLSITLQRQTDTAVGLSPYNFSLIQIDPKGILSKPNSLVDFNTGIKALYSNITVKAKFEYLKDDKGKGKKELTKVLSVPDTCLKQTSTTEGVFHGNVRKENLKDKHSQISQIKELTGRESEIEKGRKMYELEKMQKLKTLEEARGQTAFEIEREIQKQLYEREFEFSKDKKIDPKGGPLREHDLFGGSENLTFDEWWEKIHKSQQFGGPTTDSGMPMGPRFSGYRGWAKKSEVKAQPIITLAAVTFGYGDIRSNPKDVYAEARYCLNRYRSTKDLAYLGFGYLFLAWGEEQRGNRDGAYDYIEKGFLLFAEDITNGTVNYDDASILFEIFLESALTDDRWTTEISNSIRDRDDSKDIRDPEKLGEKRLPPPWAPYRHPVKHREESVDIERTPHAVDIYHSDYERKKKASEIPTGPVVNPGSIYNPGEIHHDTQGPETIWRLETWATDPDFPSGAQTETIEEKNIK
ncbi:MAG: hypothetical protein ABDH16_00015 [Thermodesulfovibrionaceae bacterium]